MSPGRRVELDALPTRQLGLQRLELHAQPLNLCAPACFCTAQCFQKVQNRFVIQRRVQRSDLANQVQGLVRRTLAQPDGVRDKRNIHLHRWFGPGLWRFQPQQGFDLSSMGDRQIADLSGQGLRVARILDRDARTLRFAQGMQDGREQIVIDHRGFIECLALWCKSPIAIVMPDQDPRSADGGPNAVEHRTVHIAGAHFDPYIGGPARQRLQHMQGEPFAVRGSRSA